MIRRNEGLSHANAKGEAASPPRGRLRRARSMPTGCGAWACGLEASTERPRLTSCASRDKIRAHFSERSAVRFGKSQNGEECNGCRHHDQESRFDLVARSSY